MRSNSRGFTLVETMFGLLIGSISLLAAFVLMFRFYSGYIETQNKVEAEQSLMMAISQLQRQFSLAVNVENVATSLNSVNVSVSDTGKIRTYNGSVMGGTPGQIDTIALFVRENGGYQTPPSTSYLPIGIFYLKPTPTTSGVIFIDATNSATKSPSYSDIFLSNIVEFSTSNFIFSPDNVLTSFEIRIVMRKFISSDVRTWNFCPQLDITNGVAGCTTAGKSSFKDTARSFQITMSNQILFTSSPTNTLTTSPFERVFGKLYLFPYR